MGPLDRVFSRPFMGWFTKLVFYYIIAVGVMSCAVNREVLFSGPELSRPAMETNQSGQGMPPAMISVSTAKGLQQAVDRLPSGGVIALEGDIALDRPITVSYEGVVLVIQSAGEPRTIYTAQGCHFAVTAANAVLEFQGVVLDGCDAGGGIDAQGTQVTITGLVLENCPGTAAQ